MIFAKKLIDMRNKSRRRHIIELQTHKCKKLARRHKQVQKGQTSDLVLGHIHVDIID